MKTDGRSLGLIDLTGQRFGKLVVIERGEDYRKGFSMCTRWRCRCDCGKETLVRSYRLRSGQTKSCGCGMRRKKEGGNAAKAQAAGGLD